MCQNCIHTSWTALNMSENVRATTCQANIVLHIMHVSNNCPPRLFQVYFEGWETCSPHVYCEYCVYSMVSVFSHLGSSQNLPHLVSFEPKLCLLFICLSWSTFEVVRSFPTPAFLTMFTRTIYSQASIICLPGDFLYFNSKRPINQGLPYPSTNLLPRP